MIIIVFGVTGSGKSTVGELLARRMKMPFFDGDNFHPEANKNKMNKGIPLTDEDRIPWLENIADNIIKWDKSEGAVVACSALNEKYRKILQVVPDIQWVLLDGGKSLIAERLNSRVGHFMNPALLNSQFDTLDIPNYGIRVSIRSSPESIVNFIFEQINSLETKSEFGIIGMGVMGKSLALNLADKNVQLSIYNRHVEGSEEGIAQRVLEDNPSYVNIRAFDNFNKFIHSLSSPRKIMLMIPAGNAVDMQIEQLLPFLEPGDVLIDGGNSFYKDTNVRHRQLESNGIHYVGAGVSGGEEGARRGPSIMPGGTKEGYALVASYFEKMAARDKNGRPCTAYVGPEGSGHFIKMVHNSIEYGEMQAITEVYYLLRYYLDLDPKEIASIFESWQQTDLGSYLLDITTDILGKYEGEELLLDKILDQAAQKGTGGWSVNTALEYGVPYGVLTEAVMARNLSAKKPFRLIASGLYNPERLTGLEDKNKFIDRLQAAYQACRIINHDVGFALMLEVSEKNGWGLDFSEIARIWTNGCIIRSVMMEELADIFKENSRLLFHHEAVTALKSYQQDLSYVVGQALQHGFSVPVLSNAINYFLGAITASSPANLIQAQRDYFGAHTYQRMDADPSTYFHTRWSE
ncbi:NADP-dependent phosphogluconate dehydrogenase [Negadavirga shengliensis]|uniref:6-phosphogluconate dehydrogenase, decarboxylating n=1 Tax=Negadavirga shengliensis TaxID=1389218 RepID=A0ABV9T5C3_9BACT